MGNPFDIHAPNIPTVGEPYSLVDWYPTILITCNCEGKHPVIIVRNVPGQCPACKRLYGLATMGMNLQGQFVLHLAIQTPKQQEDAAVVTES